MPPIIEPAIARRFMIRLKTSGDLCAEHGIVADIEMIRADQINEAYERMLRGDVKYRFVIDNRTLTD